MVPDREICDFRWLYEAFGFKILIAGYVRIYQFVKMNMNFG